MRLFSVFSIVVIVPATLLAVLGFRSFSYERQINRHSAEERFRDQVLSVQQSADAWIAQFLAPFEASATQIPITGSSEAVIRWAESLRFIGSISRGRLFISDATNRPLYPPPFKAASALPSPADVDWGSLDPEFRRAERLEFVEKRLGDALQIYESLLPRATTVDQRIALLKCIAAVSRKRGDFPKATATYRRLLANYESESDSSALPVGVVIRRLLSSTLDEAGDLEGAIGVDEDLYDACIHRRWPLNESLLATILEKVDRDVAKLIGHASDPSIRGRWLQLKKERAGIESEISGGQRFWSDMWPAVWKEMRDANLVDRSGILRDVTAPGTALVTVPISSKSGSRLGTLFVEIKDDTVLVPFETFLQHQAASHRLRVRSATAQSTSALSSTMAATRIAVDRLAPPFELQVIASIDGYQFDNLVRHRAWSYLTIISLSLLVILCGLLFMYEATKRERESAELKTDFVANVSHELKTPLTAISYIGDRLKQGRITEGGDQEAYYDILGTETKRLRTMIDNILDFSKMMAGKKTFNCQPNDLREIATAAEEAIRGRALSEAFDIEVIDGSGPAIAEVDFMATLQALLALLDNAIKYSETSHKVEIRTRADRHHAAIAVRDFGIGIPVAEQKRIFEKFHRVERSMSGKARGGVGLGLAIVKQLVEGQGGTISVDSVPQKGSTFEMIFPAFEQRGE